MKAEIREVKIDDVQLHPRNPRRGDVDGIRKSIREHGFYGVLIAQKSTGFLLKGNHTWQALKAEGHDKVRVQFLDVTDAQALAIVLVDNKLSDNATYDEQTLLAILKDSSGTEAFESSGYSLGDLELLERSLAMPDAPPPVYNESDFWPRISLQISPDANVLYKRIIETFQGDSEEDKFIALLKFVEAQQQVAASV